MSSSQISRKDFLKLIMGAGTAMGLGSVLGPLLSNKISEPSVKHDPSTAQMVYLSKLWWVWNIAMPADVAPMYDTTGRRIPMGTLHAAKDVFFLPQGYEGIGPAGPIDEPEALKPGRIRRATIHAIGKSLFFPLNTSMYFIGLNGTAEQAVALANHDIDATYATKLKMDNGLSAKRIERVTATLNDVFTVETNDPPVFTDFKPHQRAEGFTAGIWVLTNPLKNGVYDITFGADNYANPLPGGGRDWHTEYRFILDVV